MFGKGTNFIRKFFAWSSAGCWISQLAAPFDDAPRVDAVVVPGRPSRPRATSGFLGMRSGFLRTQQAGASSTTTPPRTHDPPAAASVRPSRPAPAPPETALVEAERARAALKAILHAVARELRKQAKHRQNASSSSTPAEASSCSENNEKCLLCRCDVTQNQINQQAPGDSTTSEGPLTYDGRCETCQQTLICRSCRVKWARTQKSDLVADADRDTMPDHAPLPFPFPFPFASAGTRGSGGLDAHMPPAGNQHERVVRDEHAPTERRAGDERRPPRGKAQPEQVEVHLPPLTHGVLDATLPEASILPRNEGGFGDRRAKERYAIPDCPFCRSEPMLDAFVEPLLRLLEENLSTPSSSMDDVCKEFLRLFRAPPFVLLALGHGEEGATVDRDKGAKRRLRLIAKSVGDRIAMLTTEPRGFHRRKQACRPERSRGSPRRAGGSSRRALTSFGSRVARKYASQRVLTHKLLDSTRASVQILLTLFVTFYVSAPIVGVGFFALSHALAWTLNESQELRDKGSSWRPTAAASDTFLGVNISDGRRREMLWVRRFLVGRLRRWPEEVVKRRGKNSTRTSRRARGAREVGGAPRSNRAAAKTDTGSTSPASDGDTPPEGPALAALEATLAQLGLVLTKPHPKTAGKTKTDTREEAADVEDDSAEHVGRLLDDVEKELSWVALLRYARSWLRDAMIVSHRLGGRPTGPAENEKRTHDEDGGHVKDYSAEVDNGQLLSGEEIKSASEEDDVRDEDQERQQQEQNRVSRCWLRLFLRRLEQSYRKSVEGPQDAGSHDQVASGSSSATDGFLSDEEMRERERMMTSLAAVAYLYVLYLTVFRRQVEHDASRREINAAQGLGFGANLCANLLAPICVVQVQDEIGGLLDGLMGELEALQKQEEMEKMQVVFSRDGVGACSSSPDHAKDDGDGGDEMRALQTRRRWGRARRRWGRSMPRPEDVGDATSASEDCDCSWPGDLHNSSPHDPHPPSATRCGGRSPTILSELATARLALLRSSSEDLKTAARDVRTRHESTRRAGINKLLDAWLRTCTQAPQVAHDMRTAVHFLNEFSRLAGGPAPGPAPWEGQAVAPQQINAFVAMTSILLDADAVLDGVGRGSSVPMVLRATRQAMNDNSASPAVTLAEAELRICRTGAWRYIEARLAALLWEIVDHEAMASESRSSSCLASAGSSEDQVHGRVDLPPEDIIHRKIDAGVDLIFHNAMWDQWQRLTATPDVDVLEENMRALRITY